MATTTSTPDIASFVLLRVLLLSAAEKRRERPTTAPRSSTGIVGLHVLWHSLVLFGSMVRFWRRWLAMSVWMYRWPAALFGCLFILYAVLSS